MNDKRVSVSELIDKEQASAERRIEEIKASARAAVMVCTGWPADVLISGLSAHKLYGRAGSVQIGDTYQSYGSETRCTLAEVAAIMEKLPPMAAVKDDNRFVNADYRDKDSRDDKRQDIAPFFVTAESGTNAGNPSQVVHWFWQGPVCVVEVCCVLRPDEYPVRFNINARRDHTGRVAEVLSTDIGARPGFKVDKYVKWAKGSHEYANHFTLYWLPFAVNRSAADCWRDVCSLAVEGVTP